jgi:hypothetical protein
VNGDLKADSATNQATNQHQSVYHDRERIASLERFGPRPILSMILVRKLTLHLENGDRLVDGLDNRVVDADSIGTPSAPVSQPAFSSV